MSANTALSHALDSAISFHQIGQYDRAETLYRDVLRQNPSDLDCLNLLGLLLQDTGRLSDSIAVLLRAVALDSEFPEALTNLARAQFAAGEVAAAAASAERASHLDPDLAEAHALHCRTLLALGRDTAAVAAGERAVALAPQSAEARADYGLALARTGNYESAIAAFHEALRLRPEFGTALRGLAIAHLRLHQPEAALKYASRAVAEGPEDAECQLSLAYALRESRAVVASLNVCRDVLRLTSHRVDALILQGDNLVSLGEFGAAANSYRQALTCDPSALEALAGLSRIAKLQPDTPHALELSRVISDETAPAHARVTAGFALGSAFDRVGRHEEAFSCFSVANRLAREGALARGHASEVDTLHSRVDWLIENFTAEVFQDYSGAGLASDAPVFIVGMPRSGTSLVEQIAASHPCVFGGGERRDMPDIAGRLEGSGTILGPREWERSAFLREAQGFAERLKAISEGATRVLDKLPDNVLLLGHIALLVPAARVIVCRRDLRDVGLSCYFQNFRENATWTTDLADCAARACEIERLYYHWRSVLPLNILEVDYESLVGNFEGESKRLISFLGLEWDDACLSFYRTERTVMTASSWQVRQPLYDTSVGRWRKYRTHIGELLQGLAGVIRSSDADCGDHPQGILATAQMHRDSGREAAAEAALRSLITQQPNTPEAWRCLGQMHVARGSLRTAMVLFERAHELAPEDHEVLLALARLNSQQGELRKAAEFAQQACSDDPDSFAAHLLLGELKLALEESNSAVEWLSKAVGLDSGSLSARLLLGVAQLRTGNFEEAAAAFEAGLKIDPDHVECLSKLGFVLCLLDRNQQALPYEERAVELSPQDPRALYGLALALWRNREPTRAQEVCRQFIQIEPNDPQIWFIQGNAQAAQGKFSDAEASFRRAIELYPEFHDAHLSLAELRSEVGSEADVQKLRESLADGNRTAEDRAAAGFALGMVFEKARNYDLAFSAFAEGNRLLAGRRAAKLEQIDPRQVRRRFSHESIAGVKRWGDGSELPVFVVGMPRSGTTLVEQILASHPEVFGAGERRDIGAMAQRLGHGDVWISPTQWNPLEVRREVAWHLARLEELANGAKRVIDKMPDNIMYLGHINILFPGARVIICRRDLRDVCLSCFSKRFGDPNLDWANDLRDLAHKAISTEHLINYWKSILSLKITEVSYERLVTNLASESRKLVEFLGLEWDSACLNFHETDRIVLTASQWQVRQPIYTSSIGRWKHYEKHLGTLIQSLHGYLPEDGAAEDPMSWLENVNSGTISANAF